MYNVLDKLKDSIRIVITHRLYTIDPKSFKAIVLEDGRLIEQGKMHDLTNTKSEYRNMYQSMIREER